MVKKEKEEVQQVESKSASSLDVARKAIEKKFGDVVRPMIFKSTVLPTISTRSLGLDFALGHGGVALGRHYECYGENSSGKTTLAMSIIAEAQSRGMIAAFVDSEHSCDPTLFKNMGVDLERLLIIDAYTGEKNLMVAETLMKSKSLDLLVIDSVPSLIPEIITETDLDKDTMALLARLMSKALLRLVPLASETNTCVIWINQTRQAIGGYGSQTVTPGGTALGFYTTGRIKVSGMGSKANRIHDDKGNLIGHLTTFETIKNKLNTPHKLATVPLYYGKGYDMMWEVITLATDLGLLDKAGSWYKYNGSSIGQGESGVREFFTKNVEVYSVIKDEVIISLGLDEYYKAQKAADALRNGN